LVREGGLKDFVREQRKEKKKKLGWELRKKLMGKERGKAYTNMNFFI